MSRRSGVTAIEVLLALVVMIVIAAILFPCMCTQPTPAKASTCQCNMTQISRSIKMYLSDWDDTYPPNCNRTGVTSAHVKLSPYDPNVKDPKRFVYGKNWVEALFGYIESTTSEKDPMSVWRCPACSSDTFPESSDTATVSYVFNRNLIQVQDRYVANGANLMMVREADRLVDADLRPINLSRRNGNAAPESAFLTRRDARMGVTNPALHNKGSNILFTDGHVKYFGTEYFTDKPQWDPETKQWWNWVKNNPAIDKTIAITP